MKRIEILANVLMIAVTAVAAFVLIRNEIVPTPKPAQIRVGDQLTIPNIRWSDHRATLVLALQTHCSFCAASAPFYAKVVTALQATDVGIAAFLPEPVEEGRAYLARLKIPISDVHEVDLPGIKVQGTPTVMLVDEHGRVISTWLGRLRPELEEEVINKAVSFGRM